MESYISRNMFRRKIAVKCSGSSEVYEGSVDQVIDKVLVLDENGKKTYINVDNIESFRELE